MTIESTLSKKIYQGNSIAREWTIPFFVAEASHIMLIVKKGAKTTVITGNYQVDMDNKKVIYPIKGDALGTDEQLIVYRHVPLTQIVDLENAGAFHPKVLEHDGFDRLVMQIQQLDEALSRAVKLDISVTGTPEELRDQLFEARDVAVVKASSATSSADSAKMSEDNAKQSELESKETSEISETFSQEAEFWAIAEKDVNDSGSAKYWAIQASHAIPDASEEIKGKVSFATSIEVVAGLSDDKVISPATLQGFTDLHNVDAEAHPQAIAHHNTDVDAHGAALSALENYRYSRVGNIEYGHIMGDPHFIIADGRIVNLANYPEVLEKIQGNKLYSRTSYHGNYLGMWSRHSGTSYRVPNLNNYFIRSSSSSTGYVEGDAIRNITGEYYWRYDVGSVSLANIQVSGVFKKGKQLNRYITAYFFDGAGVTSSTKIDTSLQVPTASENRPKNIRQVPVIYMGKLASEV